MEADREGSIVSIHSLLMLYRLSELMKFYDRRAAISFLALFIFLPPGSVYAPDDFSSIFFLKKKNAKMTKHRLHLSTQNQLTVSEHEHN